MQVFELDCIGTHLQLIVDTSSSCDEDFSHIRSYILDFESRYSRFVADNWLNILNKQRIWSLPKDAKNMIEYAIEVAKNTNGYFDPTIGKRLTELGYGNKNIVTISSNSENKKWFGDYRDIEIVWDELKLHGDIELEFGGVGKWYLIDIIKYILDKYPRFLINFGGDLYGRGNWEVGLESPFASDEVIGTIILVDDFLACSSGSKRKWGNDHHLIDPHTGVSATEVVATYIEWHSWMTVDIYATALCVMPWNIACETFLKISEISGVIVWKDGNIFQKEGSRVALFE